MEQRYCSELFFELDKKLKKKHIFLAYETDVMQHETKSDTS